MQWTVRDDSILKTVVETTLSKYPSVNWKKVSMSVFGGLRSEEQVKSRWELVLSRGINTRAWTPEEDARLIRSVATHPRAHDGRILWALVTSDVGTRDKKRCIDRWNNELNPEIIKTPFTAEEDALLMQSVVKFGHHWKYVSTAFEGRRTDLACKNRWHSLQPSKGNKRRRESIGR